MALFAFNGRNDDRDRRADFKRLQRLSDVLSDLFAQIDEEQAGLAARYQNVTDNAAFSLEALENDCGIVTFGEVTELTNSMVRCNARLAFLRQEMEFINNLRVIAGQFAEENGLEIKSVSNQEQRPRRMIDRSPNA